MRCVKCDNCDKYYKTFSKSTSYLCINGVCIDLCDECTKKVLDILNVDKITEYVKGELDSEKDIDF